MICTWNSCGTCTLLRTSSSRPCRGWRKGPPPKNSGRRSSGARATEQQAERLGLIPGGLSVKVTGTKCTATAALIAEARDVLDSATHPAVLDLALIGAALRIEHYEIVGYECV